MSFKKNLLWLFTIPLLISCYPRGGSTQIPSDTQAQSSPTITTRPSQTNGYIGLTYPPLPDSIKTSMGHAISPSSSGLWIVDAVSDSNNYMLWFSKVVSRDQDGKAYSQVSDVAILPSTAKDQDVIVSACLLEGVLDPEIVVLATVDEESLERRYLLNPNIILAWRANQSTGKLVPMNTEGIECYAETFLGFQ